MQGTVFLAGGRVIKTDAGYHVLEVLEVDAGQGEGDIVGAILTRAAGGDPTAVGPLTSPLTTLAAVGTSLPSSVLDVTRLLRVSRTGWATDPVLESIEESLGEVKFPTFDEEVLLRRSHER